MNTELINIHESIFAFPPKKHVLIINQLKIHSSRFIPPPPLRMSCSH